MFQNIIGYDALSQVQTRSADEPMTTFVFCNECGNRWKVYKNIVSSNTTIYNYLSYNMHIDIHLLSRFSIKIYSLNFNIL